MEILPMLLVFPAKAGIQVWSRSLQAPAFAGEREKRT